MAKKPPAQKLEDLEKEYRRLMQIDREKAREIKKKIDYIWFGIE